MVTIWICVCVFVYTCIGAALCYRCLSQLSPLSPAFPSSKGRAKQERAGMPGDRRFPDVPQRAFLLHPTPTGFTFAQIHAADAVRATSQGLDDESERGVT